MVLLTARGQRQRQVFDFGSHAASSLIRPLLSIKVLRQKLGFGFIDTVPRTQAKAFLRT